MIFCYLWLQTLKMMLPLEFLASKKSPRKFARPFHRTLNQMQFNHTDSEDPSNYLRPYANLPIISPHHNSIARFSLCLHGSRR